MKFSDIRRITQAYYSVDVGLSYLEENLKLFIENYGLEIEPEFQRAHVWTEEQQIQYVEWVLRGGPSGKEILFNCPGWQSSINPGKMQLVDGLQRITALRRFLNNEISAFGHFFKEFEDRPHVVHNSVKFCVNDLETEEEVLQWYLDINSGGTPHTEEELEKVRKMLKEKRNGSR